MAGGGFTCRDAVAVARPGTLRHCNRTVPTDYCNRTIPTDYRNRTTPTRAVGGSGPPFDDNDTTPSVPAGTLNRM